MAISSLNDIAGKLTEMSSGKPVEKEPIVEEGNEENIEVGDKTEPTGDENTPVEKHEEDNKEILHKFEPPSSWKKELHEKFYGLPEDVQEIILTESKNLQGLTTKKSQELSEKMKSIEQMEQVGSYIQSDPKLQSAFENMIKSHYEAKKNGKEWEFGKPDKSTETMKELDALVSMGDAELEAKFVEAPSKFVKSFTELLKASQEQIRSMQGEFQRQLEPFKVKEQQDAVRAKLLESLPKENQTFEFVSRLNQAIVEGDPSWEGKSLEEVFPLAVEKLTGLINTEKAKEEGKKEGKAQAELDADKRRMAVPGSSAKAEPKPEGTVSAALNKRYSSGGLDGIAKALTFGK